MATTRSDSCIGLYPRLAVSFLLVVWLTSELRPEISRWEGPLPDTTGLSYYDGPTPTQSLQMKLSVLKPGFSIGIGALAPLGNPDVLVYLLDSNGCRVITRINTPQDLADYVNIETSEGCTEYLRFFSLPETFSLTGNDYVEIFPRPSSESVSGGWNLADARVWQQHSIPAPRAFRVKVEAMCESSEGGRVPHDGFRSVRAVLNISNDVFLITEDVLPNGQWTVLRKEKLNVTAGQLGISFLLH
ncbi:MAG: hypothetical protein HYX75_09850 [Acidobacteria bacterium]|nr:hypothetical protein [Acidobacteriota bacterium]